MNEMTKPVSGNGATLPDLYRHLQDMQMLACKVQGLIQSAIALDNEGLCSNGVAVCMETASELAERLNNGLDSVSLPEVKR